MALLEVEHLTKRFSGRGRNRADVLAVDDVSFSLERGETLAVVGESGAGKSTLARLVLRLIEPDAGTVHFDGTDLTKLGEGQMRRFRRHMQMVFQDPYSSLDPRISIGRSVTEPLKVHFNMNRSDRERRARELLALVGLDPNLAMQRPHQLSGGQLQRVSIARAMSVEPKLIVCDESVAALDVSVRAQILNLLLDLQAEHGVAYLFVAHDLAIVAKFSDFLMVMRHGKVVEQGPTREVFGAPSESYTQDLIAAIPKARPPRAAMNS
jgi:peptide/nickel transport system ATP-binding protein/oligopeptide transport system ATP-binding protein